MRTFIISLLLFSGFVLSAQSKIGIAYSPFNVSTVLSKAVEGGADYSVSKSSLFGITFLSGLGEFIELESGLDYVHYEVKRAMPQNIESDELSSYNNVSMMQIPIALRYQSNPYFYVSGGALIGLELYSNSPFNSQSGIGLTGGIGLSYPFENGISLYLNPFVKLHSIVPFKSFQHNRRLLESGVKLGVAYAF